MIRYAAEDTRVAGESADAMAALQEEVSDERDRRRAMSDIHEREVRVAMSRRG